MAAEEVTSLHAPDGHDFYGNQFKPAHSNIKAIFHKIKKEIEAKPDHKTKSSGHQSKATPSSDEHNKEMAKLKEEKAQLEKSIGNEAPEPVMGETEKKDRARLEEIKLKLSERHVHLIGATGAVRVGMLEGREHIVVPVIALIEGVIHAVNASTPELVPLASLATAPQGWNGRPLMFGHPTRDGRQISANDPEVLAAYSFGRVFNAGLNGKKLTMEAWIDPVKAAAIGGQAMLDRIRANQMVEVSVGAFVTTEDGEGTHNGKRYLATWKEIVPDHLAFLEHKKGACSIEMGCGSSRHAELVAAEEYEPLDDEAVIEALLDHTEPTVIVVSVDGKVVKEAVMEALSPLSDKSEVMDVGMRVAVNKPGHVAHGKRGKITKSADNGYTVMSGEHMVGIFAPSELKTMTVETPQTVAAKVEMLLKAASYETPSDETPSYAVIRAMLDHAADSYAEISDLVDDLMAAEEDETADTPELKAAEAKLAQSQLEAISTLCMPIYGTLGSVQTLASQLLATNDVVAPRYVAMAKPKMTDCPACKGSGTVDGNTCEVCDGSGELRVAVGKRNSSADLQMIQQMHDHSMALGAKCDPTNSYRYAAEDIVSLQVLDRDGKPIGDLVQIRAARDISQKDRDKLADSDFAGPHQSFPIAKPEDVAAAAHSIGRAGGNPETIKANIIAMAYRKGGEFINNLPEAWRKPTDPKAAQTSQGDTEMTAEQRAEVIKTLVANKHSGFVAGDDKMLEAATDERLEAAMVAASAREKEVKAAEEARTPKALTTENFMDVAPPEVKALIARTQRAETERKADLVNGLKAAQSEYSESELSGMKLEDLERMARVTKLEENEPPVSYMGRGVPRSAAAQKADDVYANPPDPYADGIKAMQAARTN